MRLQEIMTTDVVTTRPDETADAAWSRMRRAGVRHLPVLDAGKLVGMLSERDLGSRAGRAVRKGRDVRDLMTPQVASAKPGMTLRQAANLMLGRLIGALPVMEDGRLMGIVTASDVLEQLGRGSTRPTVRAKRQAMRLPPASARTATRREGAVQRARATKRRAGKTTGDADDRHRAASPTSTRLTPTLGRDRERQPDSARRAPMPPPTARHAGRAPDAAGTKAATVHIRAVGVDLDAADRDYLRRKLGRGLGKFDGSIERVSVRIEDVNGPRGGVDMRCRIKVVLKGLPSVVIDQQHSSLQAAMDRAVARTRTAVQRNLLRHRSVTTQAARGG